MNFFVHRTLFGLLVILLCITPVARAQVEPIDTTTQPRPIAPPDPALTGPNQPDLGTLLPQLTPKSPTAAALGRYGEYPVSMYSGLPTIEIPIHEFTIGSLTVPIKLTYHASGNKVGDMASWVGLGWSLQTGGMITRSVQGLADEQPLGVLGQAIVTPYDYYGASCMTTDVETRFGRLADNRLDGQRDIFSYQTPKGSNSFVLTTESPGYLWLSPEPARLATTSASSFTLTDETGTIFSYVPTETASGVNYGYTSAWGLDRIVSPGSSEQAIYSYYPIASYQSTIEWTDTQQVNGALSQYAQASGISYGIVSSTSRQEGTSMSVQLPYEINFPGGKIRFVLESAMRDDGIKALDKVEVYSYQVASNDFTLVKTVDLTYGYRYRSSGGNIAVTFLSGVGLLGSDGIAVGTYAFTYNDAMSLPAIDSKQKDYWGYYNNNAGSTLIPQQQFQYTPTNASGSTTITVGDANRYPVEEQMKAWVLTRIRYPTGGYTEFDFESNRYLSVPTNTTLLAGGLRIRQIRSYSASNQLATTKTYRYGTNQSGVGTFRSRVDPGYASSQTINYFSLQPPPESYSYQQFIFSSAPTYPLSPTEGSPVTYPEVTEYEDTGDGVLGRTVYQFRDQAVDALIKTNQSSKVFVQSRAWDRGQLTVQTVYDALGNPRQKTEHDYETLLSDQSGSFAGLLVVRTKQQIGSTQQQSNCYIIGNEYIPYLPYYFLYGVTKRIRSREYTYDDNNSGNYSLKTTETDYDSDFYLPREIRVKAEGEIILGTEISYAQNYFEPFFVTDPELQGMRALLYRNAYFPIEEVQFRQESSSSPKVYKTGKLNTYKPAMLNGLMTALPYRTYLLESANNTFTSGNPYKSSVDRYDLSNNNGAIFPIDPRYALRLSLNNYDVNGNLLDYTITSGSTTSFAYNTYSPSGGVVFSTISAQTLNAGQTNAQTTTYTYQRSLLGPASMTDVRGVTTSFTYDSFGRLSTILDKDGKVLKQFTYSYAN